MSDLKPKETDYDIFNDSLIELPLPNFSYYEIPEGCGMRIHVYQQMIVHDKLTVSGCLHLDGELVMIN